MMTALFPQVTILVAFLRLGLADIPVHCVQPKIIGKWRFHVGHWIVDGKPDALCGGTQPDDPAGHQHITPPYTQSNPAKTKPSTNERLVEPYYLSDKFQPVFTAQVLIDDWTSKVLSTDGSKGVTFKQNTTLPVGEWTMVYDEGFHVSMGQDDLHHSFFAFSKYMLGPSDSPGSTDNFGNMEHSYCDMTLLGWYKQIDPATGGIVKEACWWGERVQSLHEAVAQMPKEPAKNSVPPILPMKSPAAKVSGDKKSTSSPSGGPGTAGFAGSPDEVTLPNSVLRGVQDSSSGAVQRSMQIGFCLSFILSLLALIKLVSNGKGSDKETTSKWKNLLVIGMAGMLGLGFTLWYRASHTVRAEPHRVKLNKHHTIAQAADALHADVQAAKQKGVVRYDTDPEKLKAWVRERKERHGIDIDEHSSVVKLLDAISPPLKVGVPGFSTAQVIGPAKQKAIQQQTQIANELGVSPSDLTVEDVKDHWAASGTNHHEARTFTMNGKELLPDGWKTLTDFDWREVSLDVGGGKVIKDFVNAVPDQGGCGSCYAVAATSMLTSRLMIKYPELHKRFSSKGEMDRISVDQQLRCNPYNQACGGGYPYLVAKWNFENEAVSDQCMQQSSSQGGNATGCTKTFNGPACTDRFKVTAWRYVGGALGRCGLHHLCEEALREELYKGGPLAVSVEPTAGFGYSDGVYHGTAGADDGGQLSEVHSAADDKDCKDAECFIWRKVDHSVLLVGWGEDNSQGFSCQARVYRVAETNTTVPDAGCEAIKDATLCRQKADCVYKGFPYWIIQNSYGPGYGRDGYLYFGPRGQDPMRIESMMLAADVEWIQKEDSKKLQASLLEGGTHGEGLQQDAVRPAKTKVGRKTKSGAIALS